MHPILFRIPLPGGRHFDIATYGVMMALGTVVGIFVAWRIAKRENVKSETIIDVGFWAVICGVLGAKLWFVIQYWQDFADKWDLLRNFRSGLVYYGGVLGATAAVILYLRLKRLPVLKILDLFAPPAALGLAFGRIGCFANGCCYGTLTDSWCGVALKRVTDGDRITGSPAFLDQLFQGIVTSSDTVTRPVYPTQLFAAVGVLVVFVALLLLRSTRRFYGEQLALLFILYPIVRFTVEFFRADHPPFFLTLTVAQVFSLLSFLVALAALAFLRAKRPSSLAVDPAPPSQEKT